MLVQTPPPPPPSWPDYFNLIFNLISQAPDFIYKHFSHNKIHMILQEKYITSCASACFTKKKTHPPPPSPGTNSSLGPLHTPLPTNPPVAIEQSFLNPRMITIKCTCTFICQPPTYAGSRRLNIFPYSTCSYVEN